MYLAIILFSYLTSWTPHKNRIYRAADRIFFDPDSYNSSPRGTEEPGAQNSSKH